MTCPVIEIDDANESAVQVNHKIPAKQPEMPPVALALYRLRRSRERLFVATPFAEPTWDLLLDLFAAEKAGKRVSITSACIATAVPNTTAVRCLRQLEQRGVVYRERDPRDRRRTNIRLSDASARMMQNLLRDFHNCFVAAAVAHSAGGATDVARTGRLPAELDGDFSPDCLDENGPGWFVENAECAMKDKQMQELNEHEIESINGGSVLGAVAGGVAGYIGGAYVGGIAGAFIGFAIGGPVGAAVGAEVGAEWGATAGGIGGAAAAG